MIPYPHFISLILISVVRYHELFFLRGLGSILSFADFHLCLEMDLPTGQLVPLRLLIFMVILMAMAIAMVMTMVMVFIIHLNCNYVHGRLLLFFPLILFFLLLLCFLPFLELVEVVVIMLCFYLAQAKNFVHLENFKLNFKDGKYRLPL